MKLTVFDQFVVREVVRVLGGPESGPARDLLAALGRALNTWSDPPGWLVELHDRLAKK